MNLVNSKANHLIYNNKRPYQSRYNLTANKPKKLADVFLESRNQYMHSLVLANFRPKPVTHALDHMPVFTRLNVHMMPMGHLPAIGQILQDCPTNHVGLCTVPDIFCFWTRAAIIRSTFQVDTKTQSDLFLCNLLFQAPIRRLQFLTKRRSPSFFFFPEYPNHITFFMDEVNSIYKNKTLLLSFEMFLVHLAIYEPKHFKIKKAIFVLLEA